MCLTHLGNYYLRIHKNKSDPTSDLFAYPVKLHNDMTISRRRQILNIIKGVDTANIWKKMANTIYLFVFIT